MSDSFCSTQGIMWDVRTRKLPAEYIEISSVWCALSHPPFFEPFLRCNRFTEEMMCRLRGDLGPITVWSTPNTYQGKHQKEDEWKCHYKQVSFCFHRLLVMRKHQTQMTPPCLQVHQPSPHVLQEMRLDEVCCQPAELSQ